jgi:hypothetical protein
MKSERFKEPTHIDTMNLDYFLREYYDLEIHRKKIIAAGAFGKIFKLKTKDDQTFALKSFYSTFNHLRNNPDASVLRSKGAIEEYVDNIYLGYDEYKNEFLVKLLNSQKGQIIIKNSYLMEFVEGENIYALIKNKKLYDPQNYDKTDIGIILMNYAQMLKNLHDKNYLFLDVDWSSVFYDEINKKIIVTDLDSIAPLNKVNEVKVYSHPFTKDEMIIDRPSFVHFGKIMYRNKDFIKRTYEDETNLVDLTFNSELQSFALMVDTLLNGSTLMEYLFPKEGESANWMLGEFLFRGHLSGEPLNYPSNRYKSIPKNLRGIVRDLIKLNPGQHTTSDFISAIKADYKL